MKKNESGSESKSKSERGKEEEKSGVAHRKTLPHTVIVCPLLPLMAPRCSSREQLRLIASFFRE